MLAPQAPRRDSSQHRASRSLRPRHLFVRRPSQTRRLSDRTGEGALLHVPESEGVQHRDSTQKTQLHIIGVSNLEVPKSEKDARPRFSISSNLDAFAANWKESPIHIALDMRNLDLHDVPSAWNRVSNSASLLYLSVAGVPLTVETLAAIVSQATKLKKLDASSCCLTSLPSPPSWQPSLLTLHLHANGFRKWENLENALSPPSLQWLTFFMNPIAGHPLMRETAISMANANLVAVDMWIITDDERLYNMRRPDACPNNGEGFSPTSRGFPRFVPKCSSRFSAGSNASVVNLRIRPPALPSSERRLLGEMLREFLDISCCLRFCSAARAIQKAWSKHLFWRFAKESIRCRHTGRKKIQRAASLWAWERRQLRYLKEFLAEVDMPELLLDTKEMLRLRATKRIEVTFKRLIQRRRQRKRTWAAATMICRCVRGHLARVAFQREYFNLESQRRIYFPKRVAWEFLVLLNLARRECRLAALPADYKFDTAPLIGLRIPEMVRLAHRNSPVPKMLGIRNNFLVRPCRSGRYPCNLWDGPFHSLVDSQAPQRIKHAHRCIKRRGVRVDNHCRNSFLSSCAIGNHPLFADKNADTEYQEEDIRDIWDIGTKIGEGAYGMAFQCCLKSDTTQKPYVVRVCSHKASWWGNIQASREAQWRMLNCELNSLHGLAHQNVAQILDVFVDEWFAYFINDRFETTVLALSLTSKKFGQRGLPAYTIGEVIGQMLDGLCHLHSHHVVHRDVRSENCFVDSSNVVGKPFRVLLADLNTAHRLQPGVLLRVPLGSPQYWAPEVIMRRFAHEADVWSVGAVFWMLLTMQLPFDCEQDILSATLCRPSAGVSDDQFDLVGKFLEKCPQVRCTAKEVLGHKWIVASRERHRQEVSALPAESRPTGAFANSGTSFATAEATVTESPSSFPKEFESSWPDLGGLLPHGSEERNDSEFLTQKNVRPTGNTHQLPQEVSHAVVASTLWSILPGRDASNATNWEESFAWLTERGVLCHQASAESKPAVLANRDQIRRATVRQKKDHTLAKPFMFVLSWGREPGETLRLAAGASKDLLNWTLALDFFTTGSALLQNIRLGDKRHAIGKKVTFRLATILRLKQNQRFVEEAMQQTESPMCLAPSELNDARLLDKTQCEASRVTTFQWWTEERCQAMELHPWQTGVVERAKSCGHDGTVDLWPESIDALRDTLYEFCGPNVLRGIEMDSLGKLQHELESYRCSLRSTPEGLCRVVDRIELRVRSPAGKFLVGCREGCSEHEFPSSTAIGFGNGRDVFLQHVGNLLEKDIGSPLGLIAIHLAGGLNLNESKTKTSPSELYPGLLDCVCTHICYATVSKEMAVSKMAVVGLPQGRSFNRIRADGTHMMWSWQDADWCREKGLLHNREPCAPGGCIELGQISGASIERHQLLDVLRRNGVNPDYFGVRNSQSISELLAEVNQGGTILEETFDADSGRRELHRHVRLLDLEIKIFTGAHLVRTERNFGGGGEPTDIHSFPQIQVSPFEHDTGAVRRMLSAVDVPRTSADVRLMGSTISRCCDPLYPGIVTMLHRQKALVHLHGVLSFRGWCSITSPTPSPISQVHLELQEILEDPAMWPESARTVGSPLRLFFLEAQRLGGRPFTPSANIDFGPSQLPRGETKIYRDHVWLSQPILSYSCESVKLIESLVSMLLRFRGSGGHAPLVEPVPFLLERSVREVSAAVCIQCAFRSARYRHKAVLTQATLRRASICIQQAWKWSLLTRRFVILESAYRAVENIHTTTLYIEERLYLALNEINSINRWVPMMPERSFGFGAKGDKLVLVRRHGRGKQGLPAWLTKCCELEVVTQNDPMLTPVCGLSGLLLLGVADPLALEGHAITVEAPSVQHMFRALRSGPRGGVSTTSAVLASEGSLRFVEIRNRTLAQAKQKALLLHLCTFSSNRVAAVPLSPKNALKNMALFNQVMYLWDAYSLCWPKNDRTVPFQLRKRNRNCSVEVVPACGKEPWTRNWWNGRDAEEVETKLPEFRHGRRQATTDPPTYPHHLPPLHDSALKKHTNMAHRGAILEGLGQGANFSAKIPARLNSSILDLLNAGGPLVSASNNPTLRRGGLLHRLSKNP